MPNISKLYSDATGKTELAELRQIEESNKRSDTIHSSLTHQEKVEWITSPVTRELFSDLRKQREEHLVSAINLAVAYPISNNHNQIIHLLVRVNEIDKLIQEHASIS